MNIPQPLIELYSRLSPFLDDVERRVGEALAPYAKKNFLPLIGRKKTIESLAEKIETGRYGSFDEVDDLVAFTLIVPSLAHEIDALNFCRGVFDIIEVKERGAAAKAPEMFRFDATRVYGRLISPAGRDTGVGTSIFDVIFEVQIRTAFEHAWIVATHPLTYKSSGIDWKRNRLAAQIKAGVEQLDLIVQQFETLANGITDSPWLEVTERRSVVELVGRLGEEGVVPSEASPKDMSRFSENLLAMLRASKTKVSVGVALNKLEGLLRTFDADSFPRSASLLQICMALLFREGLLTAPTIRLPCHSRARHYFSGHRTHFSRLQIH